MRAGSDGHHKVVRTLLAAVLSEMLSENRQRGILCPASAAEDKMKRRRASGNVSWGICRIQLICGLLQGKLGSQLLL